MSVVEVDEDGIIVRASGGAPTAYKPEFVELARKVCALGATTHQLADILNVTFVSVERWRNIYPEFNEALKVGKDAADERVVSALYSRAVGYTLETIEHVRVREQEVVDGQIVKSERFVEVPRTTHVPPDPRAAEFWLRNRRRKDWTEGSGAGPSEGAIFVWASRQSPEVIAEAEQKMIELTAVRKQQGEK